MASETASLRSAYESKRERDDGRLVALTGREDLQQVGDAGPAVRVVRHLGAGVGDRSGHLAAYSVGPVEQVDQPEVARRRLAHLAGRIGQIHDARGQRGVDRARHDERPAVAGVEAVGHVAGQLDVLGLVVADRHLVGVVEQDVGRHQHRIGEQRQPDVLPGWPTSP